MTTQEDGHLGSPTFLQFVEKGGAKETLRWERAGTGLCQDCAKWLDTSSRSDS